MWTDTTRAHHSRKGLALPSDLTDGEWAVLEPFFPPPSQTGRPRKWPVRRIVEAILYLLRGGLPWRMLPPCFPPASTQTTFNAGWRSNTRPQMKVPMMSWIDLISICAAFCGGPRCAEAPRWPLAPMALAPSLRLVRMWKPSGSPRSTAARHSGSKLRVYGIAG